jgi:hypothetical protein
MPTINKTTPPRPWMPKSEPFKMRVNNQHFYNSAAWRNFATAEKVRFPLCDNHETCGGVHEITDHPIPISEGGHPFNQEFNHFCGHCNAVKTGKQSRK